MYTHINPIFPFEIVHSTLDTIWGGHKLNVIRYVLCICVALSVILVCGVVNVEAGFTSHASIRINSNSDFDWNHGVIGGNGTEANPWIIEGYDINGTGYGYCIYIGNTTDYFVVRDCYLHDASGNSGTYYWNSDLILYNVVHGLVKDCIASSSTGHGGILLKDSNDNIIEHNYATSNLRGLYLYNSDDNTIIYNNFSTNSIAGVYLGLSDDNEIANSIVSYNDCRGIWLQLSCDNSINNNIVNSNDKYGIYLLNSDSNTINNNTVSSNGDDGACLYISSDDNTVYHNNFINNTSQAYDKCGNDNSWDNGYPSGGNYWCDYDGTDNYSGPGQNQTGSDGIGDTPYTFDYAQDDYPLMEPAETLGLGKQDDPEGLGKQDDPE